MARGRKETSQENIKQCIVLYNELQSYSEVGRQLNLAPNTVKRIVNDKAIIANHSDILQKIAKIKENSNIDLLSKIKSIRYNAIVDDVLSLFTKANMEIEFKQRGMRALIALQGNMFDKGITYQRLELDKRKVDLTERALELKERELNARIENPESFATVTIINDVDEVAAYYKKNGTMEEYARN